MSEKFSDASRAADDPAPGDAAEEEAADDFQTAFWGAKHALSTATAAAFSSHGVHEGQQFILRRLWAEDGLTPARSPAGSGWPRPR